MEERPQGRPGESPLLLKPGELVVLVDSRGRSYLRTLQPGKRETLREHRLEHDAIVGKPEGSLVSKTAKEYLLVFRPTLSEYMLKMPRGAQIIYPKDAAAIILWADVFPGAKVVEAGTGSGGLTLALLRAVGPKGKVISYEWREEFIAIAQRNIRRFLGESPQLEIRQADVYQGIEEKEADRLILDLPQPWLVVPHAPDCLKPGGLFLSFSPQVSQCQLTVEALEQTRQFFIKETIELLLRPWVIHGMVNRPAHRMVAHTGFITLARRAEVPSL